MFISFLLVYGVSDMNRRTIALAVGGTILVAGLLVAVVGVPTHLFFTPTDTGAAAGLAADDVDDEVVAEGLEVPWETVVLDEGRYLVTERTGALLLIEDGETHVIERFGELDEPFLGEGGLLGIALHPDFEENRQLYAYQAVDREDVENTVRRFDLDLDQRELRNEETIIDEIPSDRIHNGGRIAFGPDDHLYITTGDANEADLAQDTDSPAGKILRVEADGSVPADNPFDNEVYSYGHRNAQGLTWDDEGRLWATEHGPTARDELNVVTAGTNYGWPTITGHETHPEMTSPAFHSGPHETWAPAGATFVDNRVFFAGLRGERLYEAGVVDDEVTSFVAHFGGDYGRLRAVTVGPNEEFLYLTTSNTDGRGEERAGDDKLIRVPVDAF